MPAMSPISLTQAISVDEEQRPDSQPLLEDDRSFSSDSFTVPQEKRNQKRKSRDFKKWLLYALTLAYLPLLALYLILYLKESAPTPCANMPLDVFPCEWLASILYRALPPLHRMC